MIRVIGVGKWSLVRHNMGYAYANGIVILAEGHEICRVRGCYCWWEDDSIRQSGFNEELVGWLGVNPERLRSFDQRLLHLWRESYRLYAFMVGGKQAVTLFAPTLEFALPYN
jgi:hypothetical protein